MDRAGRIWDVTRGPFLESPLDGVPRPAPRVAQGLRPAHRRALAVVAGPRAASYLRDPQLRMLLDRYATYTGSDPRRAPAALATVPYVEQTFGAWYVRGGLRRLGEALHQRVLDRGRHGPHRHPGDRDRARPAAGSAACARPTAAGCRADVVVSDADAAQPLRRPRCPAGQSARRWRQLDRATPSLSGFVLLLALRGRTPGLAHHTVLFPAAYDAEFDSVFGSGPHRGRPRATPTRPSTSRRPTTRRCARTTTTRRGSSWSTRPGTRPATRRAASTGTRPGARRRYADRVLDVMAARGLDVRDRVLWQEIRTPADLERATGSVGGSIYGSSQQRRPGGVPAAGQPLARRPACSWSAARPIPAAACRSSACPPRSSPSWSAGPDSRRRGQPAGARRHDDLRPGRRAPCPAPPPRRPARGRRRDRAPAPQPAIAKDAQDDPGRPLPDRHDVDRCGRAARARAPGRTPPASSAATQRDGQPGGRAERPAAPRRTPRRPAGRTACQRAPPRRSPGRTAPRPRRRGCPAARRARRAPAPSSGHRPPSAATGTDRDRPPAAPSTVTTVGRDPGARRAAGPRRRRWTASHRTNRTPARVDPPCSSDHRREVLLAAQRRPGALRSAAARRTPARPSCS